MLNPVYTLSNKILQNIKRAKFLVEDLNQKRAPQSLLNELQKNAEVVSSYSVNNISGNPLTLADVKRLLTNKPKANNNSDQAIINYYDSWREIHKNLEKGSLTLSLNFILAVQKKVTDKQLQGYQSGRLRSEPAVINDPRLRTTTYWPPDARHLSPLMDELIDYVQSNVGKIDTLILAGIFHKQMVIIHPFVDGNGRTNHLVTKILLGGMGLKNFNIYCFENYFSKDAEKYFEKLAIKGNYSASFRNIDFTPWLEYFTDGVVDELTRIGKQLPPDIGPQSELLDYHLKILAVIKEKGFITDRDYAKLVDRARPTRHLDFKKLIYLGLIEKKGRSRASYYVLKSK
jgi:Fic family protein